ARNLRSTLKLSREVLSVIPINRPATNRWERGKRGLKTERSGMEGPSPVSPALVILPGFSVRDVRADPAPRPTKRDGGAGVPRR
ncbi:hypothetical protein J1605_001416, partial [Eschrichtius robustus]